MESKNIGICINRIALIVKPMQSYRDWASKIYYVEYRRTVLHVQQ
jgi:hypothetical protein